MSAVELLNKLGAAKRQLNTAIRLFFARDDEVAIHTLGAAAYRILRDLKAQSGRLELSHLLTGVVTNVAQQIVSGKLAELPDAFPPESELGRFILEVAEGLRSGELRDLREVEIIVPNEAGYWRDFNRVANFFKHADTDPNDVISLSAVQNEMLLHLACSALADVTQDVDTEVVVYYLWLRPESEAGFELLGDVATELRQLQPDARRTRCLDVLIELKAGKTRLVEISGASAV